jgi:hypothetical protein
MIPAQSKKALHSSRTCSTGDDSSQCYRQSGINGDWRSSNSHVAMKLARSWIIDLGEAVATLVMDTNSNSLRLQA